ncbi:MAG: outer membrane protein [Chitinophagaceae bacterium]|nr:outer membrane protein [Chitinophagaceae bacterium]
MKNIFTLVLLGAASVAVMAQSRVVLGPPVNTTGAEYNPSLSGDGKTMIFTSKVSNMYDPEFMVSYKSATGWSRPEVLPVLNSKIKTIYTGDYTLSHDGNFIVFTSSKYGGVGAKDIWIMEKKGNAWQPAVNPAKPLNAEGDEGDPSLSPDNKFLYFVRYDATKTPGGLPCGKIYVSERIPGNSLWKEPVALPAPINMGCECNPRILADGRTLLFASKRAGGLGEFDQYISKLTNGTWSTPKPLTFLNTPKDDRWVAVSAQGITAFYTVIQEKSGQDIAMSTIPADLQPDKVLYWKGFVKDAATKQPISARIVITNKKNNKLNVIQANADGSFHVFLPQGDTYDVAVQGNEKGKLYFSTLFELDQLDKYSEVEKTIELKTIAPSVVLDLNNIAFEPASAKLTSFSTPELARAVAFLKDNATAKAEIGVYTDKVNSDSIQAPDLTEIVVDTASSVTDSLGMIAYDIRTTYHNDRTPKQAKAIADYLISKGIPATRISYKGYGADALMRKRVVLLVKS